MQKITGELAGLAQAAVTDARKLLVDARRAANRARARLPTWPRLVSLTRPLGGARGRLVRAVNDLKDLIAATERIIEQARLRIRGIMPDGATRVVSLHDMQARPIAKGRLGKPVEFGYKAQLADNDDGIVLDHNVEAGNPPDAPMLAPAIERINERTGRTPRVITGTAATAKPDRPASPGRGVRHVVLPRKGNPTRRAENRAPPSVPPSDEVWRTGCEGRVSCLKRHYGRNRTRIDCLDGARTWAGHGVFANNLVKIANLSCPVPRR